MWFWVGLYSLTILLTVLGIFIKKLDEVFAKTIFVVLTIISSIRYGIATDYQNYVDLFYNISKYEDQFYPEVTFKIMVEMCNYFGIDFQAIFLIYSIIISVFLYKALVYWFDNNYKCILLSVCFFELSIIYGYWSSMNIIRQFAAACLVFYGLRYAYEKRFWRFLSWTVVAFLFHVSAVIILPFYLIGNIKLNKKFYILCVGLVFILSRFGIENILYWILNFIGRGSSYAERIVFHDGSGLGIMYLIGMCLFSVTFVNLNNEKIRFAFNMFFMGFCIHMILADASNMNRLSQCFFMFWYIVIPFLLCSSISCNINVRLLGIICFLLIHFGMNLYVMRLGYFTKNLVTTGANNVITVEYNINTKFFR